MAKINEQVRAAEGEWLRPFAKGPADTRWSEPPPQAGDPAPDLVLRDSSSRRVALAEL